VQLTYTLEEQDYIDYQLFAAFTNPRILKKNRNGRIWLAVGSFVLAILCYTANNLVLAIYFIVVALAVVLFYPAYLKWRYRKHYTQFVRDSYTKHFGKNVTIAFNHDAILSSSFWGEGKIYLNQIEAVNETARHLFVRLSGASSLIIPKMQLANLQETKNYLTDIGLTVNNYTYLDY
jgi:hypothetical protein